MRRLLPLVLALALVPAARAAAQDTATPDLAVARPARAFQLQEESDFSEGCFEPCMCPMFWSDDLVGRFRLVHAGFERGFSIFKIFDMTLETPKLGRGANGVGVYRISLEKRVQQMELELTGGDLHIVEHYDSGLVPMTVRFPRIDIEVTRNNRVCYDRVYHIVAAPALDRRSPTLRTLADGDEPAAMTWGRIKALYAK